MRFVRRSAADLAHWLITGTRPFRGKYRIARVLGRLAESEPIRSRYGILIESHLSDTTNYFAIAGYDGDQVADAIADLKPGDAFLDIGANTGLFSLLAARSIKPDGMVLAFEPQPQVAEVFRHNVRLNSAQSVHLFEFALGIRTGAARIMSEAQHSGGAYISEEGGQPILIVDPAHILGLITALVGQRRTVVKIDVEGAEETVVRSLGPVFEALAVTRCIIEIDAQNLARAGSSLAGVYDLMEAAGFKPRFGRDHSAHYDEIFDRPSAA